MKEKTKLMQQNTLLAYFVKKTGQKPLVKHISVSIELSFQVFNFLAFDSGNVVLVKITTSATHM